MTDQELKEKLRLHVKETIEAQVDNALELEDDGFEEDLISDFLDELVGTGPTELLQDVGWYSPQKSILRNDNQWKAYYEAKNKLRKQIQNIYENVHSTYDLFDIKITVSVSVT